MKVFDAHMREVESPDERLGRLRSESLPVAHRWVVDEPELTEERVVAEYPETGGRDVAVVVVSPERGHWETLWPDGSPCPWDGEPSEWWPRDAPVPSLWEVLRWEPYTAEELEERRLMEERREALAREQGAREAMLLALPGEQAAQDDALCALYELAEAQREVIESQDDAICAVYEMMAGGE